MALDLCNQWVKLADQTLWEFIERQYADSFEGITTGNPAKSSRMAIGTLIIKERYRFSDEDDFMYSHHIDVQYISALAGYISIEKITVKSRATYWPSHGCFKSCFPLTCSYVISTTIVAPRGRGTAIPESRANGG